MTEATAPGTAPRTMPLLTMGFRPFFLAAAAWAIVVLVLWIGAFRGEVTLASGFDPLAWHRHEMLFGYLGAAVGGFLLTAIPNWTGREPVSGGRLAALVGLWLAARLAVLFSDVVGPGVAMGLDVGFLLVMAAIAAREVLAAKNRNVPIVLVILLFAGADALDHAEALGVTGIAGAGWRLGFAILTVLVAGIGGRIIPTFTRNWLARRDPEARAPAAANGFDLAAIVLLALALLLWAAGAFDRLAGWLLILAGLVHAVRLSRWRGLGAAGDPLLFVLHLGYAWLAAGVVLLGASLVWGGLPATVALHALGAGAFATMTLAVMTRATLGHTGRALRANRLTVLAYALVMLGALLRISAPFLPVDYQRMVEVAAVAWGGAFLLFLIGYAPMLLQPRAPGG